MERRNWTFWNILCEWESQYGIWTKSAVLRIQDTRVCLHVNGKNVEEKLLTQDKCLFHVPLCLGVYIHVYTVTAIMHYEWAIARFGSILRSLNGKVGMKWSFLCKQILIYSVKVIRQSYLISCSFEIYGHGLRLLSIWRFFFPLPSQQPYYRHRVGEYLGLVFYLFNFYLGGELSFN